MNSLIFKVKILGVFAGILVSIMSYFAIEYAINYSKGREITNAILLYKIVKQNDTVQITNYLKANHFTRISQKEAKKILEKASFVIKTPIYREVFQSGDIVLYSFKNYYYYSFKINDQVLYFKNLDKDDNYITYLFIALFVLIFILFSIYRYIVNAIKPLKNLYTKIHTYANKSEINEVTFNNKDEVALVALEFDKAVQRIETLQSTRTLFWRNIMHEFKTPLTQGMILVQLLEESSEEKEQFLSIFERMKEQLDKLKQLETLSVDTMGLALDEVHILDVIDDIRDMLNADEKSMQYHPISQTYKVNTELFVIALKNLIANAIAYSTDTCVLIAHKRNHLYIINKGLPLRSSFEVYTKAFVRDDLTKNGMGLGLYLAKEILLKHKISMYYKYLKGKHLIILDLKKVLKS